MVQAEKEDEYITPHFKRSELSCRCGCGLMNMPQYMLDWIERVRNHYGFPMKITSACRCADHNKTEGGKIDSPHLYGLAIDVKIFSSTLRAKLLKVAYSNNVIGVGVSPGFIHLDMRAHVAGDRCWLY
jgi:uncharacterized protein YcbK (DUF882 family)